MGVCGIVHFILCIMMFFIWVQKGLYELINVMIIFCAVARMDYCCLVLYVLNCFISFFQYFNMLGLAVQEGNLIAWNDSSKQSRRDSFSVTVVCLLTVFYFVVIILSFFAYRYWKA